MVARLKSEDIEHLAWTLQAADGFTLIFVIVPGPASVTAVLRQIQRESSIKLPILHLDLDRQIVAQLIGQSPRRPNAFGVVGLDNLLSASQPELARRAIDELNWNRNSVVAIGSPIVFFLSLTALSQLANGAPDFFDYRSGVYRTLLAPDPRFWLYDRVTLPPQEREEEEDKVEHLSSILKDRSATGRIDVLSLSTIEFDLSKALVKLGKLDEALRYRVLGGGILDSPDFPFGRLDRLELRAEYFDKRGEYEDAIAELEECVDYLGVATDRDIPSSILIRLAKLRWYEGADDYAALGLLSPIKEGENPEADQLSAMIHEGRDRQAAFEMLQRQASAKLEDNPRLWISARYHATRITVTLGDFIRATQELATLREEAVKLVGEEHDAIGFIDLLTARVLMQQKNGRGPRLAREGFERVLRAHGISSDSTLDAVVQVKEMNLDPLRFAWNSLSGGQFQVASDLWSNNQISERRY